MNCSRTLLPLLLLLLLLLFPAAASGQDINTALEEYEKSLHCKTLYGQAIGMEALAKTRDPMAFKVLAKRYAKPTKEPPLHIRYLLATVFEASLRGRGAAACEEVLVDLAKKQKKPHDAWLYRCVYGLRAKAHADTLHARAVDKRAKPYPRAAAILALAAAKDGELLAAIPRILEKRVLPKRGHDRLVVVEACARALLSYADQGREALKPAAEAVIAQLEAKQTSERTKLVVSRFLQEALKAKRPAFDAQGWRAILAGQPAQDAGANATRVRASFFSVTGMGRNVIFVLDLSDSMLEPLGEQEVERLKRAMPEDAAEGAFAKNRFEATKLVLAGSLRRLPREMQFGIVVFGSAAELLTPTMLEATPANVKKAIALLEAVPVGKPAEDRPHGTLKGWTNVYGGLRLAFKLGKKGALPTDDEYVHPALFEEGCDTIFLLSDGEPTWSDFEGWDPPFEGDTVGDAEGHGGYTAAEGEIQHYGPHFLPRFLYADLERMTTFRNVTIHCIGIGEADPQLLEDIARIGHGTARTFSGD